MTTVRVSGAQQRRADPVTIPKKWVKLIQNFFSNIFYAFSSQYWRTSRGLNSQDPELRSGSNQMSGPRWHVGGWDPGWTEGSGCGWGEPSGVRDLVNWDPDWSVNKSVRSRFWSWALLPHSTRKDPSLNLLMLLRVPATVWKPFWTAKGDSLLSGRSSLDSTTRNLGQLLQEL